MRNIKFILVFACLTCFLFSCEENSDLPVDDEMTETEDESSDDNGDNGGGDTNSGELVTLTANPDFLVNDGSGDQSWGDYVVMNAFKINGDPGSVVFEDRFKDDGFGVAGGRWEQIDYYYEYQGEIVKASEKLVLTFNAGVTDVILQVGQMDPDEGRKARPGETCADGNLERVDESGKWTAIDENDEEIGTGILLDEFSIEGQLPDSMGSYRFALDVGDKQIKKLIIEATQWGGEESGCPTSRASYASQALNDSGNTENNSEFNIMSLTFKR